jgi:hypothetical protein
VSIISRVDTQQGLCLVLAAVCEVFADGRAQSALALGDLLQCEIACVAGFGRSLELQAPTAIMAAQSITPRLAITKASWFLVIAVLS